MATNAGKQFENKFKQDFKKSTGGEIDRIYDTMGNYKTSNICDFIAYKMPNIFYLECKSCLGGNFNFCKLSQYEKLKAKVGIPGVRSGVVLWFREYSKIFYIPTKTITKMKEDGKKSIQVFKSIEEGYRIITIPTIEKRVFLEGDYSCLLNLEDGD